MPVRTTSRWQRDSRLRPRRRAWCTPRGFAQLSEEAFLENFANGVPPERARVLAAVQGAISDTLFASPTTVAAWRQKPSWYAVSLQDRTTSPELQRFVADRIGATVIEVDAGHLSMITHPREIADLIIAAAAARGSCERGRAPRGAAGAR